MRFLLVIAFWIVIVGGLWSYITHRDGRRLVATTQTPVNITVEGRFSIELTPTFSTEADPFALTSSESSPTPLEVKLNGVAIALNTQEVLRGETIRLDEITGILAGHNEVYINASPPLSENSLEHGVRLKVFEDNTIIADETIWAEQGALVSGTISFSHLQQEEGEHDH